MLQCMSLEQCLFLVQLLGFLFVFRPCGSQGSRKQSWDGKKETLMWNDKHIGRRDKIELGHTLRAATHRLWMLSARSYRYSISANAFCVCGCASGWQCPLSIYESIHEPTDVSTNQPIQPSMHLLLLLIPRSLVEERGCISISASMELWISGLFCESEEGNWMENIMLTGCIKLKHIQPYPLFTDQTPTDCMQWNDHVAVWRVVTATVEGNAA